MFLTAKRYVSMIAGRNPWDEEYLRRGRLWGGGAPPVPPLPASSRILELGCGDGKVVSALVQKGHCVTALDFSPRAAHLCRNASPDTDRVSVLIGDARQIPLKKESFDSIIACHLSGHLDEAGRRRSAGEILRLLAPGGKLIFRDFSTIDFRYGKGEETETGTFIRKSGISTHYFTEEEVRELFSGLSVLKISQHCWNLPVRGTVFPRAEIVAELEKSSRFLPQTLCR